MLSFSMEEDILEEMEGNLIAFPRREDTASSILKRMRMDNILSIKVEDCQKLISYFPSLPKKHMKKWI